MSYAPVVFGAGLVRVDVGDGLVDFGYTRGGVVPVIQPRFVDVPSDRNGGDQGTPAEVLLLPRGATANIRIEMTEWDMAVASDIAALIRNGTEGTFPTTTTLMFAGSKTMRLVILSATGPLNFPTVIPRGPTEPGNRSSQFSTFVAEFEAYQYASGALYNSTTS